MNILFLIYDIIFILGFIIYLPVYIWRKKIAPAALKEKLGFIPHLSKIGKDGCVWIQAVSVGEVNLIGALINKWQKISKLPLVISTTTLTGNRVAKKKYSHRAKVIFFPYDVSFIIRRAINLIKPKIFVAVETEIWPNLFYHLKKKNIPILIINGRVSERAFRRYLIIKPIIKRVLNWCYYVGVQNHYYKEKFLSLGLNPKKLVISGNMKFESIEVEEEVFRKVRERYVPLLRREGNIIFIAGSTHHPEEEIIIDIYKNIIEDEKIFSLIIAPRHIERIPDIEKIAIAKGFTPIRISRLIERPRNLRSIFLLDTIGELQYFYALCDICFVGGSLIRHGGQNILEPLYFHKPVCFGPFMDNFKDIEEQVLDKGAGIKVADREQLQQILSRLIKDEALRDNLASRGKEVFEKGRMSLDKNLEMILECLK